MDAADCWLLCGAYLLWATYLFFWVRDFELSVNNHKTWNDTAAVAFMAYVFTIHTTVFAAYFGGCALCDWWKGGRVK